MNINGLTNKVDVINSVIDNIEDSNFVNAVDTLNQLKAVEFGTKEESDIDTAINLENESKLGK